METDVGGVKADGEDEVGVVWNTEGNRGLSRQAEGSSDDTDLSPP
jgi:hypothetical protein